METFMYIKFCRKSLVTTCQIVHELTVTHFHRCKGAQQNDTDLCFKTENKTDLSTMLVKEIYFT